jgi:hypothetical protein
MDARTQREFMAVNSAALPLWLAMICFPRSALTRRLMAASTPLLTGMGVAYTGMLARAALDGGMPTNLSDGDGWREVLASPQGFVTGWTHFVVFDLFVGRWIWQTALDEQRGCRLALLFACVAGPIGLLIFNLQRALRPAPPRASVA